MISKLPPRTLLFDLDGTLVDSVPDLAASANHTRAHFGLPALDEATIASFIGDGARALLERSFRDAASVPPVAEIRKVFAAHYLEHCLDRTRAFEGVDATLRALSDLPLAVVTNKPQAMAEKIVTGLGWDACFGVVVGARKDVGLKPDPALLQLAIEELGLDGLRGRGVWMVGDSRNDVVSGQVLGATTVVVSHGLGDVEEMRHLGCDHVLGRFDALLPLVRGEASDYSM